MYSGSVTKGEDSIGSLRCSKCETMTSKSLTWKRCIQNVWKEHAFLMGFLQQKILMQFLPSFLALQ